MTGTPHSALPFTRVFNISRNPSLPLNTFHPEMEASCSLQTFVSMSSAKLSILGCSLHDREHTSSSHIVGLARHLLGQSLLFIFDVGQGTCRSASLNNHSAKASLFWVGIPLTSFGTVEGHTWRKEVHFITVGDDEHREWEITSSIVALMVVSTLQEGMSSKYIAGRRSIHTLGFPTHVAAFIYTVCSSWVTP